LSADDALKVEDRHRGDGRQREVRPQVDNPERLASRNLSGHFTAGKWPTNELKWQETIDLKIRLQYIIAVFNAAVFSISIEFGLTARGSIHEAQWQVPGHAPGLYPRSERTASTQQGGLILFGIAYAMGQGGGVGGEGAAGFTGFIPLILMFVIFYFLLIRPQQKKTKEHREMIANLKKGDRIITSGGIYGRITGMDESTLTVEIADKVRVKVGRSNVGGKIQSGQPEPAEKKS
jgi:preprotein translocase subunit YajC